MDHAKTLIRSVVRAFHDVRHIIVVDALMVHSALSVDDLHHLTGIQQKDIRKLLGRLKEDRLVSVQSRQEVKVANNRPIHRDYYYINFHATIDAIKYRVFYLTKKVNDAYKPTEEKKDYFCPRCKARWTQMEVLSNAFAGGFLCQRCSGVLERDDDSAADNIGHKTQSKLMSQLEAFLDLLKQIDTEEVPQNDFAMALSNAIPVTRDSETHPVVIDAASNVKQDIKTTAKKQESSIEVKVDRVDEDTARAAEEALKQQRAAQEKQNALPSWYTHSTVDGPKLESSSTAAIKSEPLNGVKAEDEDKKDLDIKQNSEMEAYFASLRAEKEREAVADEEDEDEDDDDDDFEDVDIASGMPSGMMTPRSEVSGSIPSGSQTAVNGNGKRHAEGDTEASLRAISMSGALGNSPVKKVKLEDSNAASTVSTPGDKDSDEDEEFEDAL